MIIETPSDDDNSCQKQNKTNRQWKSLKMNEQKISIFAIKGPKKVEATTRWKTKS